MTRLVTSNAHPSHRRLASERGSVMIEALVSAVLVGIMAVAFFGALNGSERVSGVAKLRAESAALAQDDQERMRSMPVTALNNLVQSKTSTVAGINFTVESRADWIADKVKASTCTSNGGAADYLKITSTVTPKVASSLRPVAITSTVTPAPGSFNGKGSLAVKVVDRNGVGVGAVPVDLTGPATAAAFTDATGCAFFGYLPAGTTYSVGLNKGGYVDPDGDPTPHIGVTINDQQVATQGFTYDLAGAANVTFYSKPTNAAGVSLGVNVDSSQWKLVMFNGSLTPRSFGPGYPTSVPAAGISTPTTGISTGSVGTFAAPLLFPFTSAYGVYAGECSKNDPAQNGVADPGLLVPPGDTTLVYRQRIPALNVYGTVAGVPTSNLRVKITSTTLTCGGWSFVRKTNALGLLDDPGVPFGTYTVCADNSPTVGTSAAKRFTRTNVLATSLTDTLTTMPITTTTGSC
jgi:Tfp pilus assembly protein PilV